MQTATQSFDVHSVLHDLKHYLPAQAPLKDFIHHNTLHAFQDLPFYTASRRAALMFGYKVSLSLSEYRAAYQMGEISESLLSDRIIKRKGAAELDIWRKKMLHFAYVEDFQPRIGQMRDTWKAVYHLDLDLVVQPLLFRVLCSYLDQGIAAWKFPLHADGFLASLREMEKTSFASIFQTKRARQLFLANEVSVNDLLQIVVGDETLYKQYLFDQQFSHQGWSGMIATIEGAPNTLLDERKISLEELILLELLLEIDALDDKFGENWSPLCHRLPANIPDLFAEVSPTELNEVLSLWQDAYEWSYYDQVIAGIRLTQNGQTAQQKHSFQGIFCIDDRECSLRRYLEAYDNACQTFGTAGFFGVEFFYQPEGGCAYTKVCPAPVTPKYLIKEGGRTDKRTTDAAFEKRSHGLVGGALISQTLGFWSAARLALNVFSPSMSPATSSSFRHMDKAAVLTIENKDLNDTENGLQIGFTVVEMATRVENLLRSIGLVDNFASIVYVVGHGSTSVNNTHYAGYDCGACSGRPGSVNSRVFCFMANHTGVRTILAEKGIIIPETTQFLGALHDTSRDEMAYYDEESLNAANQTAHLQHDATFAKALDSNAKERSRRFELIDTAKSAKSIHEKVKTRSVSLFEPRPELNHATNTLCMVGRRSLSQHLFLDRRSFLNSYDYTIDAEGKYLLGILNAVAPVCGGINLEYYFSRVDNQKLGAGTKLAHNVMGLFGVANGADGDLRPGLPSQMIEVHDPLRLLVVVEHLPDVVLRTIQTNPATYEWFFNEWIHLIVADPVSQDFFYFQKGAFVPYQPITQSLQTVTNLDTMLASNQDNFPVYLIN